MWVKMSVCVCVCVCALEPKSGLARQLITGCYNDDQIRGVPLG